MIKNILPLIFVLILVACTQQNGGKELAHEVCECSKKANALSTDNAYRTKAQADCSIKQFEAWTKIKDVQKEIDAFNKALSECTINQMKAR
ncbi:MAG: hypothetical protein RIR12_728 [Bacteroidota bacterium]|jgi:hypothetical protein